MVVDHAMRFCTRALPSTYFFSINYTYQRWLNHVKHAYIPVYVTIVSTVIYFIALYLFEVQWEMEIDGLAYSIDVYGAVLAFLSIIVTHYFTTDL